MGLREIVGAFAGALACYGCWRWLAHLVEREVAARRGSLRYWWPTAMLAWSWFMLWATSFPASSSWLGFLRDPLSIAFFGVNLPQAIIGNGFAGGPDRRSRRSEGKCSQRGRVAAVARSDPRVGMAQGIERRGGFAAHCVLG